MNDGNKFVIAVRNNSRRDPRELTVPLDVKIYHQLSSMVLGKEVSLRASLPLICQEGLMAAAFTRKVGGEMRRWNVTCSAVHGVGKHSKQKARPSGGPAYCSLRGYNANGEGAGQD